MKIKLTLISICLLSLFLNSAYAQLGDPPDMAPEPSAASLKAAETMLEASGAGDQFNKTITVALNQFSNQIPADKQDKFKEVMKAFFEKYCNWEVIKPGICKMYAQEFTESEMNKLTTFYKTPLGIKLNSVQPILFAKAAALGQQTVAARQNELQQMMKDAFK